MKAQDQMIVVVAGHMLGAMYLKKEWTCECAACSAIRKIPNYASILWEIVENRKAEDDVKENQ